MSAAPRVLVACVGNVFFGDDGFGVEVARRLAQETWPDGTRIDDFGIRGVHLAYELLEPVDLLVLVDATSRSGAPGTLYLIDPADDLAGAGQVAERRCDAHALDPYAVLGTVTALGGTIPKTRIVGCEPATFEEGMQLSRPVEQAVAPAVAMIRKLVEEEVLSWECS